jgi:hypothetical protein
MTKVNNNVHLCPIFVERNVLSENVHDFYLVSLQIYAFSDRLQNLALNAQLPTDQKLQLKAILLIISDPNAAIKFIKY